MVIWKKRFIAIVILLFIVTFGLFVFKNIHENKVPKSAKLVMILKNSDCVNW